MSGDDDDDDDDVCLLLIRTDTCTADCNMEKRG